MRYDSRDNRLTVSSALRGVAGQLGEVIVTNPGSAGAVTAFCVAMAFFTSNAVFFQNRQHPSALFATRPELVKVVREDEAKPAATPKAKAEQPNVTRFLIQDGQTHAQLPERAPVPAPRPTEVATTKAPPPIQIAPNGDRSIAGIQELLTKLGYYGGEIDGLRGPKTNGAIDAYKNKAGLKGIELSDADLATSMRNILDVTAAIPTPRPAPAPVPAPTPAAQPQDDGVAGLIEGTAEPASLPLPSEIPSAEVVKVQAALKAFGNTDIVVDGVAGEQTERAIREFQALFRLPVSGEIDGILLDKMRAVGLIQ